MALGIPLRSCGDDSLPLRRALVAGLFPHAAKRQMDGAFAGAVWERRGHQTAAIHPPACLLTHIHTPSIRPPIPTEQAATGSLPQGRQWPSTPPACCAVARPSALSSTNWYAPAGSTLGTRWQWRPPGCPNWHQPTLRGSTPTKSNSQHAKPAATVRALRQQVPAGVHSGSTC